MPLGILFGPAALLELGKDMMLAISSLLMSCRNIVLPFSIARLSEKCLLNNIKKNEKLYIKFSHILHWLFDTKLCKTFVP